MVFYARQCFYAILKTLNLANLLFLKYLSVYSTQQSKKEGCDKPRNFEYRQSSIYDFVQQLFEITMVLNEGTYDPCSKLQPLQHPCSCTDKIWFLAVHLPYSSIFHATRLERSLQALSLLPSLLGPTPSSSHPIIAFHRFPLGSSRFAMQTSYTGGVNAILEMGAILGVATMNCDCSKMVPAPSMVPHGDHV